MRLPSTSANVTVFLLFFGLSLLEALQGRSVLPALFWLAVGLLFLMADAKQGRGRR